MDGITMAEIEEQRQFELQQARQMDMEQRRLQEAQKRAAKKKKLNFLQKVSKHWLILLTAAFFDLIGLIPGISVLVNFIFGLILWLYFAIQKTEEGAILSGITHIGIPILAGSIIDFFTGIMPTNIAATLIRIEASK